MREPLAERTIQGLHADLAAQLIPPLGVSVLDVGCGTGAWLERLATMGYRDLWGIDQAPNEHDLSGASFVAANIDVAIPDLGGRRFSLITAIEVVEHLQNPGHLFRLVTRCLAPGGQFLMTTPNMHSVLARFRFLLTGALRHFDAKGDPTHVQPVLLTGLRRMLAKHGLGVERVWGYPPKGTLSSRRSVALAAAMLSWVLPEEVSGDIMCVLVKRSDDGARDQATRERLA